MIKTAKELVRHGKVKEVSSSANGRTFKVNNRLVRLFKKKGVLLISCACDNHGRHCDLSQARKAISLCYHKWAVITYLNDNKFLERLNKLIKEYEGYKNAKIPMSIDCFINDLNDVKNKY